MQKLFISFTTTILRLFQRKISQEDLETGLFYFGCTREYALQSWKENEKGDFAYLVYEMRKISAEGADEKQYDVEIVHILHRGLVESIMKAESEGRVAWRMTEDELSTYEKLKELLTANGFDLPPTGERLRYLIYNYTGVQKLIKEAKIPLEVIF